jgi:hypothetical protein
MVSDRTTDHPPAGRLGLDPGIMCDGWLVVVVAVLAVVII